MNEKKDVAMWVTELEAKVQALEAERALYRRLLADWVYCETHEIAYSDELLKETRKALKGGGDE